MTKTPIARTTPLDAGDIVELHFGSFGGTWIKAAQIATIEWMNKNEKKWKIKNWEIRDDGRTVVFKVEALKTNPAAITVAAIISSLIVLAKIACMLLTFYAAYLLVSAVGDVINTPVDAILEITGEVKEVIKTPVGATLGIAAAALIGAIAFGLFKK